MLARRSADSLERKTLPLIRFRLLASQIREQGPPFPSLQVGDSSPSLLFESSQRLSHLTAPGSVFLMLCCNHRQNERAGYF